MRKSILILFLYFILYLLVNVCSFHPSSSSPSTLRRSFDLQNETIVNPTNYKIGVSYSNIFHICVFSLGIITSLWLPYLYTICNHVRYVCFATNLSLLSKKTTSKVLQCSSIFLSLLIRIAL